jgi:3-isopropylmalate dehydrogenase
MCVQELIPAGSMMFKELGEADAGNPIEAVVADSTANKLKGLAAGRMGYSTSEVGDLVAQGLA